MQNVKVNNLKLKNLLYNILRKDFKFAIIKQIRNKILNLCEYGCKQIAIKQFKSSRDHKPGKWCCSERHQQCPAQRKILSRAKLNRPAHRAIFVEKSTEECVYGCGNIAHYHYKIVNRWCCSKHYSACPAIKQSKLIAGEQIDNETGLTVAVLRSKNAVKTKYETIDTKTGLNGHQQTGYKSTKTKEKIIDSETGLNLLRVAAKSAAIKRKKIDKNGLTIEYNSKIKMVKTKAKIRRDKIRAGTIPAPQDQKEYYRLVSEYTEANWKEYQKIIDPDNLGRNKDWHLDHIYSKNQGLLNNIPPNIIGHYTNLQIICGRINESKLNKCDKTKKQLFEDYERIN